MTDPRAALDGWQRITGTPAQVRDRVARAAATGRYDTISQPELVPGRRDLVVVHIRMRDPAPAPVRPPARRWPVIVAGGVALAASTAVAVLAATWALTVWRQLLGAGIVALALVVAWQRARR